MNFLDLCKYTKDKIREDEALTNNTKIISYVYYDDIYETRYRE